MSTLANNLKSRRRRIGLSLDEVTFRIRQHLPENMWVTAETIRKYETGMVVEHKANPLILAALAKVYDCKINDLSKTGADGAERVRDLLEAGIRWNTHSAGRRNALAS